MPCYNAGFLDNEFVKNKTHRQRNPNLQAVIFSFADFLHDVVFLWISSYSLNAKSEVCVIFTLYFHWRIKICLNNSIKYVIVSDLWYWYLFITENRKVKCGTVQYSTAQMSVQYSKVQLRCQYSTVQYSSDVSTVQYSKVKFSTVLNRTVCVGWTVQYVV